MTSVMMILGPYPFSIRTAAYDALKKTSAWRWSSQARIGRVPALQYTGRDSQTIQLSGTIIPHFNGGLRQVELMRIAADQKTPLIMVDGSGFVWGDWVITSISDSQSRFMGDGAARKIGFDISLTEYGADNDIGAPLAVGVAASAITSLF